MKKNKTNKSKTGISSIVVIVIVLILLVIIASVIVINNRTNSFLNEANNDIGSTNQTHKEDVEQVEENKEKLDNIISPVIPNGFEYLEGTIDTGFVIINEMDKNEFVWVPVEVPEGKTFEEVFIREDGYYNHHIESDLKKCSEPLSYDGITASESEKQEYMAMISSVKKYNGFYIARYEASNDGKGNAQSKPNQQIWINIPWANSMQDLTGGAVEKARNIYPSSKAINSKDAVSTLIYGVQWDATLRWFEINYPKIKEESSDYGNYLDAAFTYMSLDNMQLEKREGYSPRIIPTGSSEHNKINNIYDMAGNAWEWTMEAIYSTNRVYRGGETRFDGDYFTISSRLRDAASKGNYDLTFRIALYMI